MVLVWWARALPLLTNPHVHSHWCFWIGLGTHYQHLPTSDLGAHRPWETFTNLRLRGQELGVIDCYNALELVTGGAVDEGDAVLVSIGQHTGTGCEVLGRPVWHFDRVCDLTGILATRH